MPEPRTLPLPEADDDFAVIRNPRLRLLIPLIVAFAFLMEQLDSTIVTTAIPDMARSLQVPPLLMNLAITSYILSLAVFIPVRGWIADRYGARRVFASTLLIFTIASALCGIDGRSLLWTFRCCSCVRSVSAPWPAASAAPASAPCRSCCRCCFRSVSGLRRSGRAR